MARQYYKVRRGMVFWCNNSATDSKKTSVQQGRIPYVVVSCDEGNLSAPTCNIAPCTTEDKANIPVHVDCWFNGQKNTILLEQIITVDQNSVGDFICMLTDETLERIERALTIQYSIRPQVKYADFKLDNVISKLESIVEEIIKNKSQQYKSAIPDSELEESALKLGQMLEDLMGTPNKTEPVVHIEESYLELQTVPTSTALHNDDTVKTTVVNSGNTVINDNSPTSSTYTPVVDVEKTKAMKEKHVKPVKPSNKVNGGRIKWTDEKRRQFLEDCDNMSPEEVRVKYGFGPIASVFQTKYMCKNILGIK